MRDLNSGAKDHLRPILLSMRPSGLSASKAVYAVLRQVSVHVKRVPKRNEGRRGLER